MVRDLAASVCFAKKPKIDAHFPNLLPGRFRRARSVPADRLNHRGLLLPSNKASAATAATTTGNDS